jgi:hypothetical protein
VIWGSQKASPRAVRSLGTVASQQNRHEVAALCFGASDAKLDAINGALPSFQSIGYEAALTAARSELGSDLFQHLHHEGGTIPLDKVDELFSEYADR